MEIVSYIISLFINTPPEVILYFLGGAAGVSVLTQIIKKFLAVQSDRKVMVLFAVISFLASGFEYLLSQSSLPPAVLGVSTATLMGIATPMYHFLVKPASLYIADFKKFRAQIAVKNNSLIELIDKGQALPESRSYSDIIPPLVEPIESPAVPSFDEPKKTPVVADF